MKDIYTIDSHKLIYHPHRLTELLDACDNWKLVKTIYPIYVEISPMGACNHRCSFCAFDYIGYKPMSLDSNRLIKILKEMSILGVKSVQLAGTGEPLLHKHIIEIIEASSSFGLSVGVTTNGTMMNERFIQNALREIEWIKVSINGGTPESYQSIHRSKKGDFEKVIKNLKSAVKEKRKNQLGCTLGAQMLLLPENANEVETLAQICRDEIGIDYLVIKPYSQHTFSITRRYGSIDYTTHMHLESLSEKWSTTDFQLIIRAQTMRNQLKDPKHRYKRCYSTPILWAHVNTDGEICGCPAYLSDTRFSYGNINEMTFIEIWEGEKRQESFEYLSKLHDISKCRVNCRMNAINEYLSNLIEGKIPHVNFI